MIHVYKEINAVADLLSNEGLSLNFNTTCIQEYKEGIGMSDQPWKVNLILMHLKGEDFDHEVVS